MLVAGDIGRTRPSRLLFEEGLRIRTTIDLRIQQAAEEAVKGVLPHPATDPSGLYRPVQKE